MEKRIQHLPIGTILDSGERRYRIVEVLGQGGFGITYKATAQIAIGNITMSVPFAIKEHFIKQFNERKGNSVTIPNTSNVEEVNESIGAFLTEAQRLNRLSLEHPGIVKVNECFRANDTAYYVMEYVDGESLRHYTTHQPGGKLPEADALAITRRVGESVQYLHSHQVTHLDIKPDNILLRTDGQPVLIDFGLAKHYDKKGRATSTLKVAGTSDGYSPVEQYLGLDKFSPQADVYALTATLLFMLTGREPEKASAIKPATIKAMLGDNISSNVCTAVLHGMEMRLEDRTQSITELLMELNGQATGGKVKKPTRITELETIRIDRKKTLSNSFSRKWWMVGIIVATLLLLGIFLLTRETSPKRDFFEDEDETDSYYDDIITTPTPEHVESYEVVPDTTLIDSLW